MEKTDNQNYINLLKQIVSIDSTSSNPTGVNEVGRILVKRLAGLGFRTYIYRKKDSPNLYILQSKKIEAKKPVLLISGHLDTVYKPNQVKEYYSDNWLGGSGTNDMKGGLVSLVYALEKLQKATIPAMNLLVVFTPDEESGSRAYKNVLKKYYKKSKFAIVLEGRGDRGELCTQRRGIALIDLKVSGKPGHSGKYANIYPNAIEEASNLILQFVGQADRKKGVSINVGLIDGGDAVNVVAQRCNVHFDFRYQKIEDFNRISKNLKKITSNNLITTCRVQLKINNLFTPMNINKNTDTFEKIVRESAQNLNQPYRTQKRDSASDGNVISSFGVGAIDGFGTIGKYIHTNNERVYIPSIFKSGDLIAETIRNFTSINESGKSFQV